MKINKLNIIDSRSWLNTAVISAVFATSFDASAYFVRPFLTFGPGETIDGLIIDGTTSSSQSFSDASRTARSSIDLETGEVRLFASGSGPSVSSSAQAVFGETLTYRNGAGTSASLFFEFDFDLFYDTIVTTPSVPTLAYTLGLHVFEAGVAEPLTFTNADILSQAIFSETIFENIANSIDDTIIGSDTDIVDDFIEAQFSLTTDNESFDVFFVVGLLGSANNELGRYVLDGENTALVDFQVDDGVSVFSDSGVFLGLESVPVPVPAAVWFYGAALGTFIAIRKKSLGYRQ